MISEEINAVKMIIHEETGDKMTADKMTLNKMTVEK